MKIAEVKVPMTDFRVDIIVGGSKKEYSIFQQKRYGIPEIEADDCNENECCTMETSKESELKGEKRFLLKLKVMPKRNLPVFVHELWHLMWHISGTITDFELNKETQMWAANMFEALFVDIIKSEYMKWQQKISS